MDSQHGSLIDRVIHASFRQKALVVMLVGLALVFGISAYEQMPETSTPTSRSRSSLLSLRTRRWLRKRSRP